jgi:transcriptional regulator with XRE-family HTH domain
VVVADRIRRERKKLGLTQEELARRAGLTLNGYADIERGVVQDPHFSSLASIAGALGIPLARLLEEEPAPLGEAAGGGGPSAAQMAAQLDMDALLRERKREEQARLLEELLGESLDTLKNLVTAQGEDWIEKTARNVFDAGELDEAKRAYRRMREKYRPVMDRLRDLQQGRLELPNNLHERYALTFHALSVLERIFEGAETALAERQPKAPATPRELRQGTPRSEGASGA